MGHEAGLVTDERYNNFLKKKENIEKEIQIKEGITAPVKKGDVLGKAVFMLDGEVIGETDIIATENVEKAGFFDYLKKILIIRKS